MRSSERNYLRKLAHGLDPIVMVGKQGADERVVAALDDALAHHELVKVRFVDFKDSVRDLAAELAASTQAETVSVIGHVAILYRQQADRTLRKIHIPGSFRPESD